MGADAQPVRVLVVDDEEDFVAAVAERLTRRGFTPQLALSGSQALQILRQAVFDAILLDLKMPGMDGLETLRAIRRLDPHVQVVFLTGHGTVSSGIEGMQLGAADFLQKPIDIEALSTAIQAAAGRTRQNREQAAEGGS